MQDINEELLWEARVSALRSVQDGIVLLKDSIKTLESRIGETGINGDYSVNHDCLKYSQKIWSGCLRLRELKRLDYEIRGLDQFGLAKKQPATEE
jgi:hypothetical protein